VTIKKVRKIADLCKFKEKNATFSCIFQVLSGVYFIVIEGEQGKRVKKVIVL